MSRIAKLLSVSALVAAPAFGQEGDKPDPLGGAMRTMLEDLFEQVRPQLEALGDELEGFVGDIDRYHRPEVLPNGDIIIRRKTPDEMDAPEGEAIDL